MGVLERIAEIENEVGPMRTLLGIIMFEWLTKTILCMIEKINR